MCRHSRLDFDCAAQGINDAPELNEQTVTRGLHQAAMMLVDFRVYYFGSNRPEPIQRSLFISADKPRIAGHIRCQDGRETTGGVHAASQAARRKPDRSNSRSSGLRQGRTLGTI